MLDGGVGVREFARRTDRNPGTVGNLPRRARDELAEEGRGESHPSPHYGDPVSGIVATGPGIKQFTPCRCRVALAGGSLQFDEDETGEGLWAISIDQESYAKYSTASTNL